MALHRGRCLDHLGGEPAAALFQLQQVSMMFGLRLAGGTDVVVKARDDDGRAVVCRGAGPAGERGFPCARPLTPVSGAGSLAVHAELFARLMAELTSVTVAPPLPNPPSVPVRSTPVR